jgi:hypothetical protein
VYFRNTDLGPLHGRLFAAPLNSAGEVRYPTPLSCDRVDIASGRGICLAARPGTNRISTSYWATTFDAHFTVTHMTRLPGVPSRARVAPSGRWAGVTVFVNGDSYTAAGFSTRAIVIDMASGEPVSELEQFTVSKDGQPFKAVDFNFWGLTFGDDHRVYATLQTAGRRYLVEGQLDTKTAVVIEEDVECPSISPDGTRIAFKQREARGGRLLFHVTVLDLRTHARTRLSESRSVDDQPEWVDNAHVSYGLPSDTRPGSTDIWMAAADGTGQPARLIEGGWSPSVVLPPGR